MLKLKYSRVEMEMAEYTHFPLATHLLPPQPVIESLMASLYIRLNYGYFVNWLEFMFAKM